MDIRSKTAAILVGVLSVVASSRSDAQDETVIADELRTAFYEAAPSSLAASMRKAVAIVCANNPTDGGWLCDGSPLIFLRGVYVTGDKKIAGFVCPGGNADGIKFYTPDMVQQAKCVAVSYDGESARHVIDPLDLRRDGDA